MALMVKAVVTAIIVAGIEVGEFAAAWHFIRLQKGKTRASIQC